ncbi:MAG: metallophosphoesterase [Polyangiaceae bacterium]|nr:metallophosphoesterase [Polyangiaceae bacterium]
MITALLHVPVGFGVSAAFETAAVPFARWIGAAWACVLTLLFWYRVDLVANDRPISSARRVFELGYFVAWCAALGTLPLFLATVIGAAIVYTIGAIAGVTVQVPWGLLAFGCYALATLLASYGVLYRARRPRVAMLTVPIEGLSPEFDGYTLVQLSDLHIGAFTSAGLVARWVQKVEATRPNLVVYTGDYVTSGVAHHARIAEVMGQMKGADGSIAVLGNHDYFGEGEPLVTMLRDRGVTVLRNARTTITRGNASIEIAGVDDTWTRHADVEKTMRDFDGKTPLIVLAHDPSLFPDFARHGAALVLSGHTHWGQVGVPFLSKRINAATKVFRFSAGVYRENKSMLYVSAGLGTTGPPVRFGSAPEITVIKLRRSTAWLK